MVQQHHDGEPVSAEHQPHMAGYVEAELRDSAGSKAVRSVSTLSLQVAKGHFTSKQSSRHKHG